MADINLTLIDGSFDFNIDGSDVTYENNPIQTRILLNLLSGNVTDFWGNQFLPDSQKIYSRTEKVIAENFNTAEGITLITEAVTEDTKNLDDFIESFEVTTDKDVLIITFKLKEPYNSSNFTMNIQT